MPGHVPTISQLRPGVIAVHTELDKDVQKYFVSGGFAFAHADSSVEIAAVEAVPLEDLDPAAVKAGLAEYTARCARSLASVAILKPENTVSAPSFCGATTACGCALNVVCVQAGQCSWEE